MFKAYGGIEMKNKTFYCGFFEGRPHVSLIDMSGEDTCVFLFRTKKDAKKQRFDEIRKVKIVEVK